MPNIASALKAEISRLARKELRGETGNTKRAVATYRHEIAEMKRRIASLEREVARLRKANGKAAPVEARDEGESPSLRFRPAGFAAHRQRLGLSAAEVGLLIGASGQSVYKWEQGSARPRAKHLEAIAAVRKMGKREASKRLEELAGA